VLISSFRLHPLADLTRLWEALHGGKVISGAENIRKWDMLGTSNSCPHPSAEFDVIRRSEATNVEALCRLIGEEAQKTGLPISDNDN